MGGVAPPDAMQTAQTALDFGKKAGLLSNELNRVNQVTPTGSLTYNITGRNKDGTPIYTATTRLKPGQRQLLGAQTRAGTAGANEVSQIIGGNNFAAGPRVNETGITKAIMNWGNKYLQPIFDQQDASEDARLLNQGIAPGSEAYTRAKMDRSRNVNDAYTKLLLEGQGTAMSAAEMKYLDPLKAIATLSGGQSPNVSFAQTPQTSVQSPDYGALANQQYQAEKSNNDALMQGLFSIPRTILGGWATGGL